MSRKAQASIEALIVLAAFFSVLAAFAPVIARASAAAWLGSATARHAQFFDELCGDARDAFVLGDGNEFYAEAGLPTAAQIGFDDSTQTLYYSFEAANYTKRFERRLGFPVNVANSTLPEGSIRLRVSNENGAVYLGG